MIDRTLAKRYAQALLDVAVRANKVRVIETQVLAVAGIYRDMKDLRDFLAHPKVRLVEKEKTLRSVFESRIEREMLEFLLVLLRKRRMEFLPEVASVYDQLADEFEGLVRVDVATFAPLSPEERKRLLEALSRLTGGRQVALTEREDKALLGGISVRIGDVLVDGSVSGRLKRLKEELAASVRFA